MERVGEWMESQKGEAQVPAWTHARGGVAGEAGGGRVPQGIVWWEEESRPWRWGRPSSQERRPEVCSGCSAGHGLEGSSLRVIRTRRSRRG